MDNSNQEEGSKEEHSECIESLKERIIELERHNFTEEQAIQCTDITDGRIKDISFEIKEGEIVEQAVCPTQVLEPRYEYLDGKVFLKKDQIFLFLWEIMFMVMTELQEN